jgi:hypothetical protein
MGLLQLQFNPVHLKCTILALSTFYFVILVIVAYLLP